MLYHEIHQAMYDKATRLERLGRRGGGVLAPGGLVGPATVATSPNTPPSPETTGAPLPLSSLYLNENQRYKDRIQPVPFVVDTQQYFCESCGVHLAASPTAPCPACAFTEEFPVPPSRSLGDQP